MNLIAKAIYFTATNFYRNVSPCIILIYNANYEMKLENK